VARAIEMEKGGEREREAKEIKMEKVVKKVEREGGRPRVVSVR